MKEANPRLIGVFVIGGAFLIVFALVLFSSQDLFTPKRTFVAYFQQSVTGLNVGAPVRFRGIPVGEVIHINGVYDPQTGNMIPRVILEFRPETLENAIVEEGEYTLFPLLLENGLRASLKSASLLTGQLYVAMDFHPGTPVRTLGSGDDAYPEMPTIDSGFGEALEKLSDLPIEEVLGRAGGALAAAEELLRNPHIADALAALPSLLSNADTTMGDVRQFVKQDLAAVAQDAGLTLAAARDTVDALKAELSGTTLVQVSTTLAEIDKTMQLVQQRIRQDDPLMHELLDAMREVNRAARSIRDLADSLEEHPESLLRGRSSQ